MTSSDAGDPAVADPIDVDALKARYDAERLKRTRPDGSAQYVAPVGRFAHYAHDPNAEDGPRREAVSRDVEVALVGAGWGGLQAAVHLIKNGVDDFLLLDRAGDVGGVWYWNRYPGIACDIDSYIYLPLLEDMGYVPTEKYARGPEVYAYARSVAEHFDLYRRALLRTEIEELRWDDSAARWIISTDHGDVIRARFVSLATGPLQRPRLPGIPGFETFAGTAFHSSRWDYSYTGGDSTGGLTGLRGKRVGVIGTGATAVQCIPHVAEWAEHLYVFQRTPAPVPVRNHRPTDREWAAQLEPGWQRRRMDNFNALVSGHPQAEDLVADGWTEILVGVGIELDSMTDDERARQRQLADFAFMERIRGRIDEVVHDPATAAALKPYYNAGCKRPCFHDDYLETFNRPNVTLVDTDGRGVDRVTPRGAVVGEREYELDCLVYATGFDFNHTDLATRNGFEIYGRDGVSLTEKWLDGGIATYHGFTTRGFPNLMIQANAQGGVTPNITHALGEGGRHFAYVVRYARDHGLRTFEPTEAAEVAWVERVHSMTYRSRFDLDCTPGYFNNDGQPTEGAGVSAFYPGSPHRFLQLMQQWRDRDDLDGFDVTVAADIDTDAAAPEPVTH